MFAGYPRTKQAVLVAVLSGMGAWTGPAPAVASAYTPSNPANVDPQSAPQTAAASAAPTPDKPNILLYVIDTFRADEIACYGAKITKTPHFDRLAAEGALFEHASSLATSTRPSMSSLVTGVASEIHGTQKGNETLMVDCKELVRVPELLQSQGYYTGAIVANPNVAKVFGFGLGFDTFEETFSDSGGGAAHSEVQLRFNTDAPVVVEKIRKFIEGAPAGKPWFLFVLSIDPHDPYTPPPPFETMYDSGANGNRDGSMAALDKLDAKLAKGQNEPVDRIRALYRGEVSYADEHFGKLIDWMRDTRRLDSTMVVVTADHGEEFAEHGNRGHAKSVYEELSHVPMILRYPPFFKPGLRIADPVDTLDLSTTLIAAGGAKKPGFWVGRDLRKALNPRPIFTTQRRPRPKDGLSPMYMKAIRLDGYKMIREEIRGATEFYNLRDDPGEQKPLDGHEREKAEKLLAPLLADFDNATRALRKTLQSGVTELRDEDLPPDVLRALKALGYIK